ncbi:MAG: hypothetical protein K0R53_1850, partial [Burkholderiales bacterium]|nr:hypothetical protein [Burkholderiales bacterium]
MNRPRDTRRPEEQTVEEIFDEVLAKILAEERERERRGEPSPPRPPLPADVAQAAEALEAMFGGNYHLTADLSFDQVYAKQELVLRPSGSFPERCIWVLRPLNSRSGANISSRRTSTP